MKIFALDASKRIFGLDLLRFFAIIFVVFGHSKILLPDKFDYYVGKLILDGVSVFFVLSGFLIGKILIMQINKGETNLKSLLKFWSRRWWRTIPAYFVYLSIALILTSFFKPQRLPDNFFSYYTFTQNFFTIQPAFYSESWSLSVEEWFYLVSPVILFLVINYSKMKAKSVILSYILITIIAVLVYRFFLFEKYLLISNEDFQIDLLTQVFSRFDGLMIGVLAAYIYVYYLNFWKKFNSIFLFIIPFLSLYLIKFYTSEYESYYYCVLVPLLKSLAVFLMLPYLSNLTLKKENFFSKSITFISLISFSMYLLNRTLIIDFFFKFLIHDNLLKEHVLTKNWILEYVLFWIITLILSYFSFRYIELFFLKFRKNK